jgi:uncharacterized membrane protein
LLELISILNLTLKNYMHLQTFFVRAFWLSAFILLLANGGSTINAQDDESSQSQPKAKFSAKEIQFYQTQVQPLLAKHCLECHGENLAQLGGYNFATSDAGGW